MTNVDELRETLEHYAVLAPDGNGVVERAKAIHRRRRRRTSIATATAAAVLVGTVPVVVSRVGHPGHVAPAVSPAPVDGGLLKLTLDLMPGQSAAKVAYGRYGHTQYMSVRPHGTFTSSGEVYAEDPGTYDPKYFLAADKVQVHGHIAYYNEFMAHDNPAGLHYDYLSNPPLLSPVFHGAVGWPDPSGTWIIVNGGKNLADLLALAENVRLGVPSRVVAPVHLGYLPRGAQLTFAQTRNGERESDLAFSGEPLSPLARAAGWVNPPLLIKTVNRTADVDAHQKGTPPALTIAGHDSWWYTYHPAGPFAFYGKDSGALFVNAGNCQLQILVAHVNKFPFDELKRIVEGATFTDCSDVSTWGPPF